MFVLLSGPTSASEISPTVFRRLHQGKPEIGIRERSYLRLLSKEMWGFGTLEKILKIQQVNIPWRYFPSSFLCEVLNPTQKKLQVKVCKVLEKQFVNLIFSHVFCFSLPTLTTCVRVPLKFLYKYKGRGITTLFPSTLTEDILAFRQHILESSC